MMPVSRGKSIFLGCRLRVDFTTWHVRFENAHKTANQLHNSIICTRDTILSERFAISVTTCIGGCRPGHTRALPGLSNPITIRFILVTVTHAILVYALEYPPNITACESTCFAHLGVGKMRTRMITQYCFPGLLFTLYPPMTTCQTCL